MGSQCDTVGLWARNGFSMGHNGVLGSQWGTVGFWGPNGAQWGFWLPMGSQWGTVGLWAPIGVPWGPNIPPWVPQQEASHGAVPGPLPPGLQAVGSAPLGRLRVVAARRELAGAYECRVDNGVAPPASAIVRLVVRCEGGMGGEGG